MRTFQLDHLVAVSGLTRGEIDRLLAEGGFPIYGPARTGAEQAFVAPDLFNFGLAGSLHRLGLGLPAIRDIVAGLGRCEADPRTGLPVELFPGQRREQFGPRLIVVREVRGGPAASLVAPAELWAGVTAYGAGVSLVIDATSLAERIAALVK